MSINTNKKTRGKGYTDIQLLFMVFLRGLGYTEEQIAIEYGVKQPVISRCIQRANEKIVNGVLDEKGYINPLYSKRVRKDKIDLIYVGGTNEIDSINTIYNV